MINVLNLFDGISCGRVALERAGIPVKRYYASEIDKYAITVAQKNYPDTVQLGSVVDLRGWMFPKIDLLMAGSPCQGFSFAGKQLNFKDERSKLFFEFVRLLYELKQRNPGIKFLLENVKMKKEYQDVITEITGVKPLFIDSSLVSAQSRKRIYWTDIEGITQPEDKGIMFADVVGGTPCRIVGRRINENGVRADYDMDVPADYDMDVPAVQRVELRLDGKSNCLTTVEKDSMVLMYHFGHGFTKGGLKEWEKSPTVSTQYHNNYFPFDIEKLKLSPAAIEYMEREVKGGRSHWDFMHHSDVRNPKSAAAVVANFFKGVPYNVLKDWDCIRKMHPTECEALQTLPSNYTEGISDSRRYHAIGNGWTVDVIAHILSFYK